MNIWLQRDPNRNVHVSSLRAWLARCAATVQAFGYQTFAAFNNATT
jgi:hypothetical protein